MKAHPPPTISIEGRPGGPLGTVTYLVRDIASEKWAIVDPTHDTDRTYSDALNSAPTPPAAIYITHGHFDHIGGLATLRRRYPDTPVWVHPQSAPMLANSSLSGADWCGMPCEPTSHTHLYSGGDTVSLGETIFQIIDAPGHCPGSVMLLSGLHLIAGDVLFAGSVGRWDLPGGDYDLLARSIREKVMPLPDETIVYPGHGEPTTIGAERRGNYIVQAMLAGRRV